MTRRHLFVKVCGITSVEDGLAAAGAGADALGFVFWGKSPRCVAAAMARRIGDALPPSIVRVGVFVDAPAGEMARVAEEARLDVLQLHGSEPPEAMNGLPRRAWKALRVGRDFAPRDVARYASCASGILLDAHVEEAPGGTGKALDWSLARRARDHAGFLILAGGLTAGNVAQAIAVAEPDGVDVSSGVETSPGVKDIARVRAFVDAARRAS